MWPEGLKGWKLGLRLSVCWARPGLGVQGYASKETSYLFDVAVNSEGRRRVVSLRVVPQPFLLPRLPLIMSSCFMGEELPLLIVSQSDCGGLRCALEIYTSYLILGNRSSLV